MILNQNAVLKHISDWLKLYCTENNRKKLVVPVSGGVNSQLSLMLCQGLGIKTTCVHQEIYEHENILSQLKETCQKYNIELVEPPLLSSMLPELVSISGDNGLIVGSINRNKMLSRHYHKYFDALADIFPIADLFESEVRELVSKLDIHLSEQPSCRPQSIELDFDELEWGDRENQKYNIIERPQRPETFEKHYKYSKRQREIISLMWQREKKTRHKALARPMCEVRHTVFVR